MESISFVKESSRGLDTVVLENHLFTDRRVFIDQPITMDTAVDFSKKMMYLEQSDEPIDIYISCAGGAVDAGLLMYDVMQSCENEINTYCLGFAGSMASILLAAGQKSRRFVLPHSKVMIHEVLVNGGIGGSATSISRISDSIIETRDLVNSLLAKHTGKTLKEINRATSYDNFMTAKQAVAFGICDAITDNFRVAKE